MSAYAHTYIHVHAYILRPNHILIHVRSFTFVFAEGVVRIQSVQDGRYWAVVGGALFAENSVTSLFRIRPSLVGAAGAVSFESVTKPNHYIRHAGYVTHLHPYSQEALYKNDASFRVINEDGGIRYQSVNYPNHSLAVKGGANGRIAIVPYAGDKAAFLWRTIEGQFAHPLYCPSMHAMGSYNIPYVVYLEKLVYKGSI